MDFRSQMLRLQKFEKKLKIDALLVTHTHFDHILGLAEVRPLTKSSALNLYCSHSSKLEIEAKFDYFFSASTQRGGGIPSVVLHEVVPFKPFFIEDIEVVPILVMHGRLEILGYRIGNFAYITDCSLLPQSSFDALRGVEKIVLNGLRSYSHVTHFSFEEAILAASKIGAKTVYLTHIAHNHTHSEIGQLIKKILQKNKIEQLKARAAFDFLQIDI